MPETTDGDTGAAKDNLDEEALLPQEVKELALQAKAKAVQLIHLKHLLKSIVNNPSRFKDPEFRFVREFVTIVENHRDKYPPVMGDKQYNEYIQAVTDGMPNNNKTAIKLTSGYVLAVSRAEDTSLLPGKPILQIAARDTFHQRVNVDRGKSKVEGTTQITQFQLCDGDGNTMLGRVATHLASEARKLNEGDIIELELYTELTHKLGTSTPKPAVFILGYSHVGYAKLPEEVHDPLCCDLEQLGNDVSEGTANRGGAEEEKHNNLQREVSEKDAECTFENRLCSLYGVSMLQCICKTNPVTDLDLNTVREDCHFANKKVKSMTNNEKRCMIYWWYATNIYSICGKKKRRQLPNCLVKAVRDAYPEESGVYEGFSFA